MPTSAELVAELSSALCSAASKNLAAVSGLHSLAETMLLLALKLLRLISTNHSCALLSGSNTQHRQGITEVVDKIINTRRQ